MAIKYTNWPYIPKRNFQKIDQCLPLHDPLKFTQIDIFGVKIGIPSGNPVLDREIST
jgi:hypothetical protein